MKTQHKRREITQMAPKPHKKRKEEAVVQAPPPSPVQLPTPQAMQDNTLVLELTRRFQRGELSGEAMLAVLNSIKPQNT